MLNLERDRVPRNESVEKSVLSIGAMTFAKKVAAEYQAMETGYRNQLYGFFGRGLTSYLKFLKDPDGYDELLGEDNISPLREKPDVKSTSRLVLYYLTGAQNGPDRNTAGKYARVVDYLYQGRIAPNEVADHVRNAGGMDAILLKARGHEAPKVSADVADETLDCDDPDSDQGEETYETVSRSSASGQDTDEIFDPHKDLSIRVSDEARAQVLTSEIAMNDLFYLECKKVGLVGREGMRIVGRLVKSPSE